ncbi:DNA mismatch repair protein MutL [bacterium HR19]|nr:DNA mismatch repair protein MutL [bacterium HR19]
MADEERKIKILPEKVANLIAAGEVVERPASVAKELIENSIDAGARKIEVFVKGRDEISVFDDGEGMSEGDLLLCFQKHATSKISSEEDLTYISTFGFRGEALHAISLVSKMIIRTKRENDEIGTEISIEGGKLKSIKKVFIDTGTQVIVKDIFFNTPARKKFLSRENVEFSYIVDVFSRFALAFPNLYLKLIKDEKIVLNLKPKRTLSDTISSLFGSEPLKKDKFELLLSIGDINLEGIIWRDKVGAGRWIFVNKRYVKDKTVFSAISKFNFLKSSDFIIFISCPPEFYDVNVNPTKTEIRWRAPSKIKEIIITAIEESIRHKVKRDYIEEKKYTQISEVRTRLAESKIAQPEKTTQTEIKQDKKEQTKTREEEKLLKTSPKILTVLRGIIAVVEWEGELYLVDIHAYHEGKIYSSLKEKFENKKTEKLRFVTPFEVEVPKRTAEIIKERKNELYEMGIEAEFQENKIIVKAIPFYLSGVDLKDFFLEVEEGLDSKKIEKFLAGNSCRTALRKGDRINIWDISAILSDFDVNQRCPHGRPAVIKLDIDEIEEKFGRC